MSSIVINTIASAFNGACYSKLNSRELAVVNFLLGIDALELRGNKVSVR